MSRFNCLFAFLFVLTGFPAMAESDYYAQFRQTWLKLAEKNKPQLTISEWTPKSIISVKEDTSSFQDLRVNERRDISEIYITPLDSYENGVIFDFGRHMTGYLKFSLKSLTRTPDAPLRLKFTFGETLSEVKKPIDPYFGSLSRAWFQDETVTVSILPEITKIPRRVSFRYLKVEILAAPNYKFTFDKIYCEASTSAGSSVKALPEGTSEIVRKIDSIGLNTLSECMQTVYEDGPKRDRRLWIGDLYLESLANNCSFRQFDLTRRCLYLLAGVASENGILNGTMFEYPYPQPQKNQFLLDYTYLYNVTLLDYLKATGDRKTVEDLWPVAKRQAENILPYVTEDKMIDYKRANKDWWIFIDWKKGLDKEVAITGLVLFALDKTYELAGLIGKESDVSYIPELLKNMRKSAHKAYYDKSTGLFASMKTGQYSYQSQIWAALGGIASHKESVRALTEIKNNKDAVRVGTPYAYHYYIQALIDNGLSQMAKDELVNFWGGMVEKGADTFWEAYDPSDDYISPYNCYMVNSYCHAWSCTPVYFIRTYPDIFK